MTRIAIKDMYDGELATPPLPLWHARILRNRRNAYSPLLCAPVYPPEFNYRMADARMHTYLRRGNRRCRRAHGVIKKIARGGFADLDLTGDEMAKLHLRHLVGGRANADNEMLYRFEFPERPGALMNFLAGLNSAGRQWNISLFHYRNHGADAGRVLAGIQVPPPQRPQFAAFLRRLGYRFCHESDNPAYRLFLSQ